MAKGQPSSIRLDEQTERLVETEARRTRRSKSAVATAVADNRRSITDVEVLYPFIEVHSS